MGQSCRQCGRSMSDRHPSTLGLCGECAITIGEEVQARVRSIQEGLATLANGADSIAKLEQCDRILQEAEELHRFEAMGILTTSPPPSTLLADFRARRQAVEKTLGGSGKALTFREEAARP